MDRTLVGLVLLVGGGAISWKGYRLARQIHKYEFEHRADGGVVQFDTYEKSIRHEWKRRWAGVVLIVGVLTLLFGLMGVF